MEVNREEAVGVSKEEEKEQEATSTNKAEEDNILGGSRMGGNMRLDPGCRLTTSRMGSMNLTSNMASKEEESRFRDQKRTQRTLTHHMRPLQ